MMIFGTFVLIVGGAALTHVATWGEDHGIAFWFWGLIGLAMILGGIVSAALMAFGYYSGCG